MFMNNGLMHGFLSVFINGNYCGTLKVSGLVKDFGQTF